MNGLWQSTQLWWIFVSQTKNCCALCSRSAASTSLVKHSNILFPEFTTSTELSKPQFGFF
jgi:hypothetical protein